MITATLNVKISSELKEKIRAYAEERSETLGQATEKLLTQSLKEGTHDAAVQQEDIDNQFTAETRVMPLDDREIKALRKLLKKKK